MNKTINYIPRKPFITAVYMHLAIRDKSVALALLSATLLFLSAMKEDAREEAQSCNTQEQARVAEEVANGCAATNSADEVNKTCPGTHETLQGHTRVHYWCFLIYSGRPCAHGNRGCSVQE